MIIKTGLRPAKPGVTKLLTDSTAQCKVTERGVAETCHYQGEGKAKGGVKLPDLGMHQICISGRKWPSHNIQTYPHTTTLQTGWTGFPEKHGPVYTTQM